MESQIQRLKKRVRVDSDHDSAEMKRLREDLLGFLDDSDPSDPSTQALDSFIKSFEEEISAPSRSASPLPDLAPVIDLTSDTGESQPDLGCLLEASDDELGLPPSGKSGQEGVKNEGESAQVGSDSSGIGEFWGFEDRVPSYGLYYSGTGENFSKGNEFVAFDGLFGYSDVYFDSSDFSDLSWRSETLPAQ